MRKTPRGKKTVARAAKKRCQSGVEGLDEILCGGFPRDCVYLVQGDPGSGKTTLALQFLLEGVRRGEPTFYITLSETRGELLKVARSHEWSLDEIPLLELSAIEELLKPEVQTTIFHPSEMELSQISDLLISEASKTKPLRVVFDSLSEFRLLADTPLRYRRQLLSLKQHFARYGSTVLLLDDKMSRTGHEVDPHVLSLSHGVIEMEQLSPDYGTARRRLRITKLRGVKFREGYHDYIIETGGLRVFPRLVAAEHQGGFKREPISSGLASLDALLGGGLDRGTTALFLGTAGTGKSTLALQYAVQMAKRGDPGVVFAFDETREIMLARARGLGLGLDRYLKNGAITVQQVDPAELSPGEFADRIRRRVDLGCRLIVIDSINGYLNAMPGERYLNNQLHELTSYLNQKGALTILVLAQHGLINAVESPADLSYLSDAVIYLRFFEAAGVVKQSVAVIKKRTGPHEKTIREIRLEPGRGIRVGEPLADFHGILSGSPLFGGALKEIMRAGDGRK
jgi:circadian clock protein KaiC